MVYRCIGQGRHKAGAERSRGDEIKLASHHDLIATKPGRLLPLFFLRLSSSTDTQRRHHRSIRASTVDSFPLPFKLHLSRPIQSLECEDRRYNAGPDDGRGSTKRYRARSQHTMKATSRLRHSRDCNSMVGSVGIIRRPDAMYSSK